MRYKILALFLLAATVGTAAVSATHLSGEGTINRMQVIPTNISNNTQMTVLISVYDQDGNPVNPNKCPRLGVQYVYNSTYSGERDGTNMTYIPGTPNRFYATFPVDTRTTSIDFYADGTMWGENCGEPLDYIHNNVTINPKRNLSIQLLNATPNDRFVEGKTYSFWANVTYNNSFQNGSVVNWSLHDPNGTMVKKGSFTNWTSLGHTDHYNTTLTFPDVSEGRYFLNITAHVPDAGFVNATGGIARTFIVNNRLEGDGPLIFTDTCAATGSGELECQKGTEFTIWYNVSKSVTHVRADTVLAWVSGNGKNQSSLTLQNVGERDWKGSFSIGKDFNTSTYGTKLTLTLIAKNSLSRDTAKQSDPFFSQTRVSSWGGIFPIQISPFIIETNINPLNKYQGDTIHFQLAPRHEYTDKTLQREKIDSFSITVTGPGGNTVFNVTYGENGTSIPDSNYNSEQKLFNASWDTAADIEAGEYTLVYSMTDIYNYTITDSTTFNIYNESKEKTSEVITAVFRDGSFHEKTTLQKRYTATGLKQIGNFFLKNNGSLDAELTNVSVTGDLINRTNISFEYQGEKNVSTPFRLNGNSQATIHLNLSLEEYRDYNGTIKFNVSSELKNYTVTLETDLRVKKDQIPCPVKNGTLCLYNSSINTEYTEKGTHNLTMRVGNRDSNVTNISLTTTGNITALMGQNSTSQIIEVGNQSIREFTLQLMTQKEDNGYYTGNLTFMNSQNDTFTVPISVVVDIPVASFRISVIDNATLGTVVKGQGSISFTIEINNSGSKPITNMSLDVPKLNIQKDIRKNGSFITLQPGELVNVTVTSDAAALPAGDYTSGNEAQVTVTAAGGASASAQVSLTVIRNVNDEISELESNMSSWNQTIKQLPEEVSASKMGDIRDKFSNYRQKVTGAREAWNNGNYQEAESRYEEARQLKSDLQKLISEAKSAPSDDEPSTNETDDGNGGNGGGGGGGGGFNILFLLIPLIIILVIGVIIYLSIVPEEEASQDEDEMEFGPPQ